MDEIENIAMEYDTAEYAGFTLDAVKEIAKRYARIMIEKDRESQINEADGWFNKTDIIALHKKTEIKLS